MTDGAETKPLGLTANFAAKTAKRFVIGGVYMKVNPARFHTNRAVAVSILAKA